MAIHNYQVKYSNLINIMTFLQTYVSARNSHNVLKLFICHLQLHRNSFFSIASLQNNSVLCNIFCYITFICLLLSLFLFFNLFFKEKILRSRRNFFYFLFLILCNFLSHIFLFFTFQIYILNSHFFKYIF